MDASTDLHLNQTADVPVPVAGSHPAAGPAAPAPIGAAVELTEEEQAAMVAASETEVRQHHQAKPGNILVALEHNADLRNIGRIVSAHAAHLVPHPESTKADPQPHIKREHFRLFIHDTLEPPTVPGQDPPANQRLMKVVVHREPTDDECDIVEVWVPQLRATEEQRIPKHPGYTHDIDSRVLSAASSAGFGVNVLQIRGNGAEIEFIKLDSARVSELRPDQQPTAKRGMFQE